MSELHPLVGRITLVGGVQNKDLHLLQGTLAHLFGRLSRWPAEAVEMRLRVKDRDEPGMKTTLELRVPSLPALVATSQESSLGSALHEVGDTLVHQLNGAVDKRSDHGQSTSRL